MTSQRRSLTQALQIADLPVEALAIIEAGNVQPLRERTLAPRKVEREPLSGRDPTVEPAVPRETERPSPSMPARAPRGLVSLSVRVQSSLADCLLKVAFERRMQNQHPHSQQDIVTQAVRQWLKRNGYPTGED